ncbi:hypothetical protein [Shewanella maritima]|uniref:hypothetical protein n=1 Tax=Shewanella maritima TaxID=2520507 RepID=UPI0037363A71
MNSQVKRSRKSLLLLLAVFILPIAAAKLVLSFDLYQGGATNKGQLFDNNMSYQSLNMENPSPQHWQVVFLMPQRCTEQCQERLYILNQSYIALGKGRDRVTPVIATTASSDTGALSELNIDFATVKASPEFAQLLTQQNMIIIDPLGSLVMDYPAVQGQQQNIALGKSMIADLRKMLKLSRVG